MNIKPHKKNWLHANSRAALLETEKAVVLIFEQVNEKEWLIQKR